MKQTLKLILIVILSGAALSACSSLSNRKPSTEKFTEENSVHNYVYFALDRDQISNKDFLNTEKLEGAQLVYMWKELEPTKDHYDFSVIQSDLDILKSKGKKLFIQIKDTTFSARTAVPQYLLEKRKYHGGVVNQYDKDNQPAGRVAMRWVPAVRRRFQKLLKELGKAFDGKVEGIALQETSIDIETSRHALPRGFTYAGYRDAILSNMKALKKAFPKSVTMQYANFMPEKAHSGSDDHSYLRSVYEYAEKIQVGVGAPDLLPKSVNYSIAYDFMNKLKTSMPVGVAAQDGNYLGLTNDTSTPASWPDIVPEMSNYARTFLHASYIFWGAQEPYFSHDVVPFLK